MTDYKIEAEVGKFGPTVAKAGERPRVSVDIDGVIATEGAIPVYGPKANWNYSACKLVDGAREGLSVLHKRYHVTLYSSRWKDDLAVTISWLDANGIKQGSHYDEIDLGVKPRALLYLDDRAYRFKDWGKNEVIRMVNYAEAALRQE